MWCEDEARLGLKPIARRVWCLKGHRPKSNGQSKFESLYVVQQSIRHLHGRPLDNVTRAFTRRKLSNWAFQNYLDIAPPSFAVPAPAAAAVPAATERDA